MEYLFVHDRQGGWWLKIDNRPALELIPRFNFENVLIYCDPPYMLETRNGKQYRCEMDNHDHEALLDMLLKHKGYVIISGYDTELYNSKMHWKRINTTGQNKSKRNKNAGRLHKHRVAHTRTF